MKNREIARMFEEIADIMEIRQDNVFKIRAYRRAALNLEGLNRDLAQMSHKELLEIPGIGADLAARIEEHLQTGTMAYHDQLKQEVPAGVFALLAVPDLGPKTAKAIYEALSITSLEELEQAAREHRLVGIKGIKEKTEENILKGIQAVKRGRERQPLGRMLPAAEELVAALKQMAPLERIEVAGSIRRRRDSIKDIDIVATSPDPASVMEAFLNLPQVHDVIMRGPTRASVTIREGVQVDLRVVEPASYGAALAYLTGSQAHNVRLREMAQKRGLKINEYGIFREEDNVRLGGDHEEDVYRLLDLPFVPPVLREDRGEIEAAQAGKLPQLVTREQIRGDLHVHSRWSDGAHGIADLAEAARLRGLFYIAVTDHSQGLGVARGLTVERLREQHAEIRELNRGLKGFRVLHGTEMDIRGDGTLDFPDEALKELDVVVASIHSGFSNSKEVMTARIVAAMRNPYVHIIAHPTGRIIGEREGYQLDMEEVLQAARETGTALEINAYPLRLDLEDRYVRRAKELGVKIAINTDSHVKSQFETLHWGIAVAQRGWLERADVLNTLTADELLKTLKKKRGKRL
ncbi:DNA polymerase/3'-5' exonuclease PolX [Geomonas azotofigens]|uniref:DNA polymerase/3'-5' exonuclease PolX n=1 Tax=Geomonas azotofigens TaxID=2843196 RepID=UPI001C10F0A3|nr:DNA polymerase/3'-5' exonuclease PolX [Geomonas azotofigens]MBU5612105.1 DNA polymerase/3'-5' exonuclease PolX [Geomonas azotofigens]